MKTIIKKTVKSNLLKGAFVMLCFLFMGYIGHGQNAMTITLQNCSSTSNTIQFDLVIENTSDIVDTLSAFQAGITFNQGIINGGTITAAYVDGSTQLIDQNQNDFDDYPPVIDPTSLEFRLPGQVENNYVHGTRLPVGTSILVGTFQIINSNNWTSSSSPNFAFDNSSSSSYTTQLVAEVFYKSRAASEPTQSESISCSLTLNQCTAPSAPTASSDYPTYCPGGTINLSSSVGAGDPTLTYAWIGPNSYSSSAQNPSISSVTTAASGTYSVTISNSCGSTSTTTSLTVNSSNTPTVSIAANPSGAICSGASVTFTATPASGDNSATYQWYLDGNTVGSGGTTYSNSSLANSDYVSCTLTTSLSCPTSSTANSNTVTMTVYSASQPGNFTTSSATVNKGQNGVVYTVPNDPSVSYNWTYNGTGATINGTGNSVTVNFSSTATSGNLSVTATSLYGCGTSAARTIAVTTLTVFTPGNLAVLRVFSSTDSSGTILEINPSSWTVVDSFNIPMTGSTPLRFSSAASSGFLSDADGGTLLAVTGWDTIPASPPSDITVGFKRGVGTLTNSYGFSIPATYTGVGTPTDNQTRGATSLDGTNWYATDKGGIYTQGSTSPIVSTNSLSAKAFGNQIYFCQAGTSLPAVDTLNAGQTALVGIHGLPNGSGKAQDFCMVSSGQNGGTYDILYIVEESSATAGQIDKYSLVNGSWTSNGTAATTWGSKSVLAVSNGSGAYLYVTSGTGATAGNYIYAITDVAGYNATLNVSASINNQAFTFNSATILKGIALAPCSGPPTSVSASSSPVCQGSTLSFTASATGAQSYSWSGPNGYSSYTVNNSGSETTTRASATTAMSGTYTVTATNISGSATATVTVTVNPLPTATVSGGGTVCSNQTLPNVSIALTGSQPWSLTYAIGGVNQPQVTGITTSPYVITGAGAGNYTVTQVSDANCTGTFSGSATVIVNSTVTPSVSITSNAGSGNSISICAGTNVTFTATPTNGGSPSYQWYYGALPITDANQSTYSASSLEDGNTISCQMTSTATCASPATVTSNTITITVTGSVTPSVTIASGSGNTNCSGATVSFTATPTNGGSTPSYQWYDGSNTVGTNSATYTTNALANGDVITCVMTSSNGCASPTTATSNGLTMTVTTNVTPSVSIAPSPSNTICPGTSVTFTATPTNGGSASYAWTLNSNPVGSNSATYSSSSLNNNDVVACTMTSSLTCVTSATASSNTVTITVNQAPTPSISGTLSFCSGGSTTLDAGAGYSSYSWSTGETTETISPTTDGSYSVTVSNGTCSGSSSPVTVTVNNPASQPGAFTASSASVFAGQTGVVYTVPNVAGVTYNWTYNGTGATINGTGNSVTVNFSNSATSGNLSVTATNGCGGASSPQSIAVTISTFTPGNLAVLKLFSSTDSTGTILEINPSSWTVVDSFLIPATGSTPLRFTSAATSGFLANAENGTLLTVAGWDTTTNATSTPDITVGFKRGVGTLTNSYAFNIPATYTGVGTPTDNQTRGATSLDGTNWYISDKGGIYVQGSTTPIVATNTLSAKAFGNQIYFCQASSSLPAVDTLNAGQTALVGINGLPNGSGKAQDFCMISSGQNGSTYDILYIVEETSATAGQIDKYSLVNGSWTSNGTAATTWGSKSVLAVSNGSGAYLYVTSGTGATAGNYIYAVTDVAGYNATLNVSATINNKVYTNTATTILKGIAFAPTCPGAVSASNNTGSGICAGSTLSLSASSVGGVTYSWSGPGYSSTLQNPSVSTSATSAMSGTYTVTTTPVNNGGCPVHTATTTVTVNALPTATVSGGGTVCSNQTLPNVSIALTGSQPWSLTYAIGGVNQPQITGITTSPYVITGAGAGNYTVTQVSDANCTGTFSGSATVIVNSTVTPSVSITSDAGSGSISICSGTNVNFTATPTNGGSPSYQWTLNGGNVGSNSATYSNNGLNDGDQVVCNMTSTATCASPATVTSNTITITVTGSVTPSVTIASGSGNTNCSGATVSFTATPTNGGSTPSYQWYDGSNTVGTNSATYTTNALANGDVITCVMTSSNGCASPTTATSNGLTMTVTTNVTPSVSIAPSPSNTICPGTSVTFTATPTNGGSASYAWTLNSNPVGSNSATYSSSSLNNNDVVACTMTSSLTCVTSATASSNTVTITVNQAPTPSISGTLSFCSGGSTTLDAGAGYSSYSWSTGETTETISPTTDGSYSVTVSNGTCSGSSSPVTVTVNNPASQPGAFTASSASIFAGQNGVVYTVPNVAGVTYNWTYNGTGATINGTGNSVTVNFSNSATSGNLSVTATNGCGGASTPQSIAVTISGFAPGNLAVLQVGNTKDTTGTILELSPVTASQSTPANTFAIPATGPTPLRFTNAGTNGNLATSNDGSLLAITGFDTTAALGGTMTNGNLTYTRGVATLNSSYAYNMVATYTGAGGATGNQSRCATSLDNTNWYIGDQGGFYTNGTSSPSPAANLLNVKSFGGTVYLIVKASGVGTVSAITGGTITYIPGTTGGGSGSDFYLISSGSNGSTYDILYVIENSSATAGQVDKYSLVSGTWTANGTYSTGFGGKAIVAQNNGSGGAYLYVTTKDGGTTAGSVIRLTDAAGYNATLNITAGNNVTLYTASSLYILKGIAFAPTCPGANANASNNAASGICSGNALNLTSSATGAVTYSWSGPDGFSSTSQNPTVSANATADMSGTYTVTATPVNNGCAASTATTTATINASPTATITPGGSTTFCDGGSVTLTASAGDSYLWSDEETTQSITATANGDYTVTVTANGCSATSNATTVTVNSSVTPSVSIAANTGSTICGGTDVTFTATPVNGGTASYAWTLNSNPVGDGSDTYSNSSLNDGDVVACTMTSSLTCVTSATVSSNSITMSVTQTVTPSVSIAANTGNSICTGTSVTFTATPVNGGTASYAWTLNSNPVGDGSDTYSNSSLNDGDVVACTMTSGLSCVTSATASSNSITISVSSNLTPSVGIAANTGSTICAGTSVTFTATPVNGGSASYAWTLNGSPVGGSSATYSSSSLSDGDVVACTMTSSLTCVTSSTASSNNITMSVTTNVTPSVSIAADPGNTICSGTGVTFTATPVNGGSATYAWTLNGSPVGGSSDTYSSSSLADGGVVACTMTSSLTCVTSTTASSNSITMSVTTNVTPSVSIAANPGNTICSGTGVTFTATPTNGGTASYAWTKNGSPAGSNSATLVYPGNTLANGDVIACTITSSIACVTSATASSNNITMVVNNPPTVSITGGTSICIGATTTLSPTTGGTWASSNNSFATVTNAGVVTGVAAGSPTFTFTTTGAGCSATTAAVTVNVCTGCIPPAAPTGTSPQTFCSGSPHTVANLVATGSTIQWYSAATGGTALLSTTVLVNGHTYYATQTVNCQSTSRLAVAVIVNTNPTVAAITGAASICQSASTTLASITLLDATAGGVWSATPGTGSVSVDNTGDVTGLTAGTSTISYAVTSINGCITTVSKVITVSAVPVVSVASSVSPICNKTLTAIVLSSTVTGTSYNYTASGDVITSGYKNVTGLKTTTIAQTLLNSGTIQGVVTYTITPVSAGCTGSAITTSVTVNPIATGTATPSPVAICTGDNTGITLNAGPVSGTTFTYTSVPAAIVTGATLSCTSGCGTSISDVLSNTGVVNGIVTYSVTPWANGCAGTVFKDIVTVRPIPTASTIDESTTVCNKGRTSIVMTGTTAGTVYNHTATADPEVTGFSNGAGATIAQTLYNAGTTRFVVTYIITPVYFTCSGTPITATVTVNPVATGTATPSSEPICTGVSAGLTLNAGPVSGTSFEYTSLSTALPTNTVTGATASCTSGCGTSINDILSNGGVANGSVTYSITPWANGCAGTVFKDVVTVRPVPVAYTTATLPYTVCNGVKPSIPLKSYTSSVIFLDTASLTTTPDGGTINGFSDVTSASIAQLLTNTGTSPGVVTYNITPSYYGCLGATITAAVTVNPVATGTVTPTSNIICSGYSAGLTLSAGPVSGTTFEYTSVSTALTTDIVTGATASCTSGCGTSISDILINGGTANGTVTYTIIPWANGCAGTKLTDAITVRPVPVAYTTAISPYTICNGVKTNIPLTSHTSGTIFLDTASLTTTPDGGTVNGFSDISSASIAQTLTNTGTSQGVVTYNVTPSYYGCLGATIVVTATVNPVATGSASPSPAGICSGFHAGITLSAGAVSGTHFAWAPSVVSTISGATSCTDTTGACGTSINSVLSTTALGPVEIYTITPWANGCAGTKFTEDVTVQYGNPVKPGISGPSTKICAGNGATYTYTATSVATFNNVIWTIPNGCTITAGSLTTNSITISYPAGYSSGMLSVIATNLCGDASTAGTLTTNTTGSVCRESDTAPEVESTMNMTAYPNPAHDIINVQFNRDQAGSYTLQLMDLTGRLMMNRVNTAQQGNNLVEIELGNYAKGVYMLSLTTDDGNRQVVRIVVE